MYLDDILEKINSQEPEQKEEKEEPEKKVPEPQKTKLSYCDDFMKEFRKDS